MLEKYRLLEKFWIKSGQPSNNTVATKIFDDKIAGYIMIQSMKDDWDDEPNPMKHYNTTDADAWIRAEDLCRLGMLLCNGGTLDGVTILQPETVEEMMSSQEGKGYVTVDSPYGLCV